MHRGCIQVTAVPQDYAANINIAWLAAVLLDSCSELQPSVAQHKGSARTTILLRTFCAGKALPSRQRVRYLNYLSGHSYGVLPCSMRATG